MAKPTYYPEWATTDTTLPVAGTSNKSRPKESLRTIGWDKSQIPAAEELNWQLDNVYDWVVHFDTLNSISKTVTFIGDVSGSFSFSNNSGTIGNVDLQVADNSHNHTSANISDATSDATPNMVARRDLYGNCKFVRVRVEAGSAANPSLYWAETDDDTGFYHPADGSIGIAIDGTSIGAFNSTGWTGQINSISPNISILTGTILHGGTIPLPSGYTQAQCRWFVSMNNDNTSLTEWDIEESLTVLHYHTICEATAGRLVNCFSTVFKQSTGLTTHAGTANYMIIGFK